MISAVRGWVFDISPNVILVETSGGLILELAIPVSSYSVLKTEKEVLLHTVLRVKEEQMLLYGFRTLREKQFFEKFTAISGIGGKIAMSLISAFSPAQLVEAVNSGDIGKISSIPGIGKKTAQRIVLELTGKLSLGEEQPEGVIQVREDLASGLVNLGFPAKTVTEVVKKVCNDHPDLESFGELFKLALKQISKL